MKEKRCFKCKKIKSLDNFYKHPQMGDGYVGKCKECNKKDVRDNYSKKRKYYNEYDKERQKNNLDRMFGHRYNGMKSRIEGRANKRYNVEGRDICTREEFISWCKSEKQMKIFLKLHKVWAKNSYTNRLSPSIDRVNNSLGYILDNIQWMAKTKNCSKYTS